MIIPPYLHKGDKIAILSPATEIKSEYIDGAADWLSDRGYVPMIMPHAKGESHGTFAASDKERIDDFRTALCNPEIKMIFCGRGGYGAVHLLNAIDTLSVRLNPKWLLGFSDISILHALWQKAGIVSIHASMAKQLTLFPGEKLSALPFEIAEGYTATGKHPLSFIGSNLYDNIPGFAEGEIVGGNLAVLNGLASTPWDILDKDWIQGKILFLEDVGEKIYQVERMLTRLYLSGTLHSVGGIIFGQFTDYSPDRNFKSIEDMISTRFRQWGITTPTLLGAPIGHIDGNYPIPEGGRAILNIDSESVSCRIALS